MTSNNPDIFDVTLNQLTHVQKPYQIDEIFSMYQSGNYNAELLLQHCLIKLGTTVQSLTEQEADHKIEMRDYSHQCGDGCCYESGKEWYVDGKFVHSSPCEHNGWLAVLNCLGIQAELIGQDESGEDVWSL